ncbi:MAG: 3-isopropylmalate dehydrogenase, partial [Nitrospira sp.]|nr:3-isopropylmalate dehydrogenase [Nitrospira sp.]
MDDPDAQIPCPPELSSSYIPALEDTEFLRRDELRPIRIGLELLKAELIQREEGVRSTIVVFGSARIHEPAVMKESLERAEEELTRSPDDPQMRKKVAVAKRQYELSKYYDIAREFG